MSIYTNLNYLFTFSLLRHSTFSDDNLTRSDHISGGYSQVIAYDLYDYCFSYTLKAKFHYASWFEPDSVMEFGRGPASSCYFAASKLDDRPDFSSLEVCDQLRTT